MISRSSGILVHPSSLPGPFGIGDFGPIAIQWIDTLAAMKQTWWQILPLGPTGFGDSPYQAYSAFAGSILLLSPERLAEDDLISSEHWQDDKFDEGPVDYDRVRPFKEKLVRHAWTHFRNTKTHALRHDYDAFIKSEAGWLDDYARFMAFRASLDNAPMSTWPADLRNRKSHVVRALEKTLQDEIGIIRFGQFLFDRQWSSLKHYAKSRGIQIIGDLPIFVSGDSADVWANPQQFLLDEEGHPKVVAGVPPDYFAVDGQHWGNPIYDWDAMATDGYRWWIARIRQALKHVDLVRLDHFRGFAQAWHIPAGEKTARNGHWVDGPGMNLFTAMQKAIGHLPLIAEDLGLITPDVEKLRATLGLPGMRVLQFAVDGPRNPYWPHNYETNTVCYTGTHDNDTTIGWASGLGEKERKLLDEYVGHRVTDPSWELIRLAWSSVAKIAIAPLQDLLALDGTTRMNVPGQAAGNWRWRLRSSDFRHEVINQLAELTTRYARTPRE